MDLVRLESIEEAKFLQEIEHLGQFVCIPAVVLLIVLPEVDVELRIVLAKKTLLLETMVEIDIMDHLDGVFHLVLHPLDVGFLQHLSVIVDRFICFHDFSVESEGFVKLLVDFVGQGTHVLNLVRDWALSIVDGFLDGSHSFTCKV